MHLHNTSKVVIGNIVFIKLSNSNSQWQKQFFCQNLVVSTYIDPIHKKNPLRMSSDLRLHNGLFSMLSLVQLLARGSLAFKNSLAVLVHLELHNDNLKKPAHNTLHFRNAKVKARQWALVTRMCPGKKLTSSNLLFGGESSVTMSFSWWKVASIYG